MGAIVSKKTYPAEITGPDGEKWTAKLKALDAGDQADVIDAATTYRKDEDGDPVPHVANGTLRILTTHRAVVSWDLTDDDGKVLPLTESVIRSLEPDVLGQLFEAASFGRPKPKPKEGEAPLASDAASSASGETG